MNWPFATVSWSNSYFFPWKYADPFKNLLLCAQKKTTFQGLSLQDAKRGVSNSFNIANKNNNSTVRRSGLEITARTAGASKNIEVEVDKPLGLTLGPKQGGGVVITVSSSFYLNKLLNHFLFFLWGKFWYMYENYRV